MGHGGRSATSSSLTLYPKRVERASLVSTPPCADASLGENRIPRKSDASFRILRSRPGVGGLRAPRHFSGVDGSLFMRKQGGTSPRSSRSLVPRARPRPPRADGAGRPPERTPPSQSGGREAHRPNRWASRQRGLPGSALGPARRLDPEARHGAEDGSVRISAPSSVIAMVCSLCAERAPVALRSVHPSSGSVTRRSVSRITQGSSARRRPGRRR